MAESACTAGPAGDQPDRSIHFETETLPELEYYDMSMNKKMIIFNHYDFDVECPESREKLKRRSTMRDVESLENTFGRLKFDVETYHDKSREEILGILGKLCKQEHKTTSCVCVCVLTHGGQDGQLCARDKTYYLSELLSLLQNHAPGLMGKPKLVIVQACRGGLADAGQVRVDGPGQAGWLPSHVDTFMLTASVEDYISFREPNSGSWLIQELCRVVAARHRDLDVLHIATLVAWLVAQRVSYSNEKPEIHNKKQTVEKRSTLTKLLRLHE